MGSASGRLKTVLGLIVVLTTVTSLCMWVYLSPQSPPTFPNTPFILSYLKEQYTVCDNGTAKLSSTSLVTVWFASYRNASSVVLLVRDGLSVPQRVEVNLFTRETNVSKGGLKWWIYPSPPLGSMVDIDGNPHVAASKSEESVQQLVRDTVIFLHIDEENISVAKYDGKSGFLVDLKVRHGDSICIYRLQSVLGAQLSISRSYYLRAVLLCSLIPSLVVFLFSIPRIRRKAA
ncbi:MAG: hypothetical protein ACTSWP_00580 [Candidatus Freyarchaeota archaeon]|nr:hypothetical protein [Candidatus Freyrarchaeum guaymaensis]